MGGAALVGGGGVSDRQTGRKFCRSHLRRRLHRGADDAGFHPQKRVEPKRLQQDAPNVLIILVDDAGPGLLLTYGNEVNTPALDRPQSGYVTVSQQPLVDLRASMAAGFEARSGRGEKP